MHLHEKKTYIKCAHVSGLELDLIKNCAMCMPTNMTSV